MQENLRDRAAIERILSEPPFHKVMGFRLGEVDVGAGVLEIVLPYGDHLQRMADSDQIHGGVIATLIDVAATFAMMVQVNKGVPTVDLRIDYLRAAGRTDLTARAQVRRAGRTVGTADVEVRDDQGRIIALGRALFATGM